MQPVVGEHLIDHMEAVGPAHATKEVIIEYEPLLLVEWAATIPDLPSPEHRRLWNRVPLPHVQNTTVALERTGMLAADKAILLVNETAAPHDDVPAASWIDLFCHASQGAGGKGVIGVEETEDVPGRSPEP